MENNSKIEPKTNIRIADIQIKVYYNINNTLNRLIINQITFLDPRSREVIVYQKKTLQIRSQAKITNRRNQGNLHQYPELILRLIRTKKNANTSFILHPLLI